MKKIFSFIILVSIFWSPLTVFAQAPTEPLIENERTQDLGSGTFPDVAFLANQLWVVVQQDNVLNIYRSGANNQNLTLYRTIQTGGGQAFPRITAAHNIIWIAYRDASNGQQIRLWRSDTEAIENLGVGYGNSPVVVNPNVIAWQADSRYQIRIRSLTGGTPTNAGVGRPTGLSRVIAGGQVITIDRDRNLFPWGTKPAFAGPLTAVEGPEGGVIITFNNQRLPQDVVLDGIANDPRAAQGPNNLYAITAWAPSGSVRVASFNSTRTYSGNAGEIEAPDGGSEFGDWSTLPTPLTSMNFQQLLQLIINYSFYILGIVLFAVVFWAGFEWFTAAGNAGQVAKAKGRIYNVIIGAILLAASYVILNTINPDLTGGNLVLNPVGAPPGGTGEEPNVYPPGVIPPGVNRPTVTLPDLLGVVQAYADQNPTQVAQSCTSWDFLDGVVAALRAADPRIGYNGRRGNTSDPSRDAVAYYFGPMPPIEGSRDVYVVDVINNVCPGPGTHSWADVTPRTWQGGTTGAYIGNR